MTISNALLLLVIPLQASVLVSCQVQVVQVDRQGAEEPREAKTDARRVSYKRADLEQWFIYM